MPFLNFLKFYSHYFNNHKFFKHICIYIFRFKQTDELDATVRSFFPYGIDKDVVKKIHISSDNFDDYQKIFIAVVTSNVKQNVKLFKNKEFLDTAERFATSEAGKLWFHK